MENKVILYIGFYALPDCDAAAHRVFNNAKALISCGHKVIFIDEQKDYKYNSFYESKHTINGIDVWSLRRPTNAVSCIKKLISIEHIKFIVQQYKKIDLIIAYNYPSIALNCLRKYCTKNAIKIALDCTEWYSGKDYIFPLNIICAVDSFFRMRIINPKLDGIICISSYLQDYYQNRTKTVKIPPLVDIEEDIWHQDKINFDKQKINLVYGGNPGRCKDLLKPIIHAINKCENSEDIIFRIVGITEEQYLTINPEDRKSIKSNIIFLGKVSHKENVRIVSSSDYLVFIREKNRVSMAGFSTKFVEAMTSNIEIITTDSSDIRYYTNENKKIIILETIDKLEIILKSLKKEDKKLEVSNIFDYRNYIDNIRNWINSII